MLRIFVITSTSSLKILQLIIERFPSTMEVDELEFITDMLVMMSVTEG